MLTNDAANRLDAINDAMALVTLMDELIGARKPGSHVDLSDTAASGLSLVLDHVVEVLGDAAIGLHKAQAEIAAAGSDYSNETYRRGYRHGYVDAVKEEGRADAPDAPDTPNAPDVAPTPVLTEAALEGRVETAAEYKQKAAAFLNDILDDAEGEAPTPTLTEAVPPEEREQAIPDEPRQRA